MAYYMLQHMGLNKKEKHITSCFEWQPLPWGFHAPYTSIDHAILSSSWTYKHNNQLASSLHLATNS